DQAAGRNGAHQVVELTLDGGQVLEDVRVVELQIVQDGRARAVVDELGTLVEEGAVVLVRLDDEERRIAQPGGNAEVLRNAANQETRRHTRIIQQPGQQGGGGGVAVGSGHRR